MTDLEKALAPKARKSNGKSDKLWLGFALTGEAAKTLVNALDSAGITNRSDYLKKLVLSDLGKHTDAPIVENDADGKIEGDTEGKTEEKTDGKKTAGKK